jgi:signal transduction histidine kinase
MTSSLQARLLLAVGTLALSAVLAVALVARLGARQEFLRFQSVERREAQAPGPDLAGRVARDLDGRCCPSGVLDGAAAALGPRTAILVTEPAGGRLLASAGRPLAGYDHLATRRDGDAVVFEAGHGARGDTREVVFTLALPGAPLHLQDGTAAVLYLMPFPNEGTERNAAAFLGSLDRLLLGATAVVGLMALAGTWLVARGVVRPLRELGRATAALAHGDLSVRVEPRGGRESAELGRAFNAMALELERQYALRRALIHDVAHELRTPVTALRCRLETVLDGLAPDPHRAVRDLHEEVLHLGRLVDDLQDLALAEARDLRLEVGEVPVRPVVESAVRAAGLDADPRLRLEVAEDLVARADAVRLRQVVLNLLTNADRHTPASGTITVRGTVGPLPDGAAAGKRAAVEDRSIVEVTNTGSRLEPDDLPRVFDRFYRADPSRARGTGGTGLGLAIVRHLVEAQGGAVWARCDDVGVTVGFGLPRR